LSTKLLGVSGFEPDPTSIVSPSCLFYEAVAHVPLCHRVRLPAFQLSCVRLCCWSYSIAHQFHPYKIRPHCHAVSWLLSNL